MAKDKLDKEFLKSNELGTATERALEAMKPYSRQIAMGALALAVLGVGYLAYGAWSGHQAAKASAVLAKSLRIQSAQVTDADDKAKAAAKALSKPAQKEEDEETDAPKFKTHGERNQALLKEFQQARNLGPRKLSMIAQIGEAGVLLSTGKYAEAEAAYRRILGETDEKFALRFLVREDLGYALEAQNKLKEALQVYKELEPKEGGFYRDRALFHQARMYEKLGDDEKAEKAYEQARKLERTPLFESISARLNALKAKRSAGKPPAKDARPGDKATEKTGDKPSDKPAAAGDKAAGKPADKPAAAGADAGAAAPAAEKPADKPAEKAPEAPAGEPAGKGAEPAGEAPATP